MFADLEVVDQRRVCFGPRKTAPVRWVGRRGIGIVRGRRDLPAGIHPERNDFEGMRTRRGLAARDVAWGWPPP